MTSMSLKIPTARQWVFPCHACQFPTSSLVAIAIDLPVTIVCR